MELKSSQYSAATVSSAPSPPFPPPDDGPESPRSRLEVVLHALTELLPRVFASVTAEAAFPLFRTQHVDLIQFIHHTVHTVWRTRRSVTVVKLVIYSYQSAGYLQV